MLSRLYHTDPESRKRQINTLKVFNDNVTEVTEGSEYQVFFNSGGNNLSLIVTLPNDFPNERPMFRVSPVIVHSWVNCDGEITTAPGLLNFTVHSDLGRVVQAVIREFERESPPLASEKCNSDITSPIVPMRDSEIKEPISPSYPINYGKIQNSSTLLAITFPELNMLSLEELQFLHASELKREEFLDNVHQVNEMNKNLDEFLCQVEEIADSNLSVQERLSELRNEVDHRLQEITKLTFENERLNVSYQTLSDKYAPRNIKHLLKLSAENSENESEKIAESFLNGEMDVDKFVSLYLTSRTLTQTRKTKEEKLAQQLDSLERAGF